VGHLASQCPQKGNNRNRNNSSNNSNNSQNQWVNRDEVANAIKNLHESLNQ
jgi:hypothetical protein